MKKLLIVLLLVGCQKHEDTPPTSTSTSASTSTSTSATPLATIEPSAAPSAAIVEAGMMERQRAASLSKEAEAMQMQMLKTLGGSNGIEGALSRGDIAPVDLSALAAQNDAGRIADVKRGGDLHLSGGGAVIRPGSRGGLSELGSRDH